MVFKSLALAGPRTSWIAPSITYIGVVHTEYDRTTRPPVEIRAKGTNQVFSNLATYIFLNTADATIVFTFIKNGADGNQTLSIPAGVTGVFEDDVNTDSVVTGDEVCTEGDASAATINGVVTSMLVYAVTDDDRAVSYQQVQSGVLGGYGLTDGTTGYMVMNGDFGGWGVTPTADYTKVINDFIWDNLRLYIPTNQSGATQTFYSYINGARGNQVISVPGTTGRFEDVIHSDSILKDDEICIQGNAPAVGGTKYTYVETGSSRLSFAGNVFQVAMEGYDLHLAGDPVVYLGIGGHRAGENDRTEVMTPIKGFKLKLDLPRLYVSQYAAGMRAVLLDGVSATGVEISPAGTGWTDGIGEHVFDLGNYAAWEYTPSPSGSQIFEHLILRGSEVLSFDASKDLFCEFNLLSQSYEDLKAVFRVGQDCQDLFSDFVIRRVGVANFFAKFTVSRFASKDLKAFFTSRHSVSADLSAKFVVRHSAHQEFFAEFIVRHADTADLFAEFIVQQTGTQGLFSEFIVRYAAYQGLFAKFVAQISLVSSSEDLSAEFIVRHVSTWDLFADLFVKQTGTQDLFSEFVVRHSAHQGLFAKFVAQISLVSSSEDFYAKFTVRQVGSSEILSAFIVRHSAAEDLKAVIEVAHWVRLPAYFWVRHPSWLWTSRRYLNGVVNLTENKISDAILEYVIEGVMVDVRGFLVRETLYYGWENILEVPTLIKRAVTYGTVASLFARGYLSIYDRIQPSMGPRKITIVDSKNLDRAMEYWEAKMSRMLEMYRITAGQKIIWVDTEDEEPVFTMEDIPLERDIFG